jgi:tricarballylate dehydrogenase
MSAEASRAHDVVVVGGGNAGLCAALSARAAGARVLVLERSSREWRGGNSKYTRNIRCAHTDDVEPAGRYLPEELLADLAKVTGEGFEQDLAELAVYESESLPAWMERFGVLWQPAIRGTLQLDRTNKFFLGGGKALINTYYRAAEAQDISILHDAEVTDLEFEDGVVTGVRTATGTLHTARSVVVASGGFEANFEWLKQYWGDAADNFVIRGTSLNDGRLLSRIIELGAMERGQPGGFHAIAVDARSPRHDGGIVTRVDSLPMGVTMNRDCLRFYDEGEDIWPKRYAVWGRLVAEQPGQLAYSFYDSQTAGRFIPPCYPPYTARTIGELATQLALDPARVEKTIGAYNRAARTGGPWDNTRLDQLSTQGLSPNKTNWALPIDHPPYYAFAVRPGITFTYLGVAVDRHAHVLKRDGGPFPNLFGAGEVMAGNILRRGYLGGFGMTIGTVFGRIAGASAAEVARA